MRSLSELRGMRFPDEYVVRMFFKEGLQRSPGRVLELGCGNGNNLMLFSEFGWKVVGIDFSQDAISDARFNLQGAQHSATFVCEDLSMGMPSIDGEFDAIILPSFNYYVSRTTFSSLLKACAHLLKKGGIFYVRSRTPDDWRFGKGKEVERNGFVLECTETGEQGCLNVFYTVNELEEIIDANIGGLEGRQVLRARCENPQGGAVIVNDDVVIWGRK